MHHGRLWRMRKLLFVGLSLGLGACATPKVPAGQPIPPETSPPAPTQASPEPVAQTPNDTEPASTAPTTPVSPIVVTLLEAGEEPRMPLRIKPKLNERFSVTQRTQTKVSTLINAQPVAQAQLPTVVQTILYQVVALQDDRVTFAWTANMEAESAPGVDPAAVEKMKAQLANAKNLKGQSVFDLRGVLLETSMEQPDPDMQAALSHLWSPFPAEPVGVGASWQTQHTRKINGFDAVETTVYAIDRIEQGMVVTSADANTQAQPGPFHHPDLPPGATVFLKSMNGSSSKTTSIANASFFQNKSEQNAQLTTVLDMKSGDKSQEITTETTLKIESQTQAL